MRRKLPCLIVGHRYDGIRLPSIDMDNRATCRHAAGTLLGRGCRKLVLLLSKSHRAGDLASITGFREAVKAHPGAEGQILETTDDATIICKRLDGLWLKEEPLGFVVLNPYIFITLYLHAGRLGRDFAAVSVYDDECLRYIPQAVARYSNVSLFQQASALVARQVFQPPLPCRETLLIPQFIDGRSAYLHDR